MPKALNRRTFLALGAALGLAACGETGPVVEASFASTLRVTDVTATTTVTRAETALPKTQIVKAAREKVAAALMDANPNGSRAVIAQVKITQFYIANAVAGIVLGSNSSSINTEITLVDAATGIPVQSSFRVFGVTEPRPTIIGAGAIKAPEVELAIITNDLARRARVAIYGK